MPKTVIETTGDLRQFLTNMMLGIRNGDLSTEKGSVIVKGAQQVNESFYSETKVKQVEKSMGGAIHDLGKLPIR
jgi:hypothetical protein